MGSPQTSGRIVKRFVRPAAAALLPLVLISAWIAAGECCLAQQPGIKEQEARLAADVRYVPPLPLLPRHALKTVPSKFEVYQYDESPLNGRAPLLLIHGLEGEFHRQFRWTELARYLSKNEAFQRRYKIFLARFNSHATLQEMTRAFNLGLRDLPPEDRITIVAISMPCLVVHNAMRDPAVDQSISRVLTLGGFFRGSPLFCKEWMHETIAKRHLSPLCRLDRYVAYKLYFALHKNLLLDYRWDNVDRQMPTVRPSQRQADLDLASDSTSGSQMVTRAPHPSDSKFVVYAAYLHNQFEPRPHWPISCLSCIAIHLSVDDVTGAFDTGASGPAISQ